MKLNLILKIFIIGTLITLLSTNVLYAQGSTQNKSVQLISKANGFISQRINSLNKIQAKLTTLETKNIISKDNKSAANITNSIKNSENSLEQLQNSIDKNNVSISKLKEMVLGIFNDYHIYRFQIPKYYAQIYLLIENSFQNNDKNNAINLNNILNFEITKKNTQLCKINNLTTTNNNIHWLISYNVLTDIQKLDPALITKDFNNTNTYVIVHTPKYSIGNDNAVEDFTSYATFAASIANKSIYPNIKWVMYDNENSANTPKLESSNPKKYEILFANLAHKYGYKVILTPAQNLFNNTTTTWKTYLSSGLVKISSQYSNIYNIQSQRDEETQYRNSNIYYTFIKDATTIARVQNKNNLIFSGLSTNNVINSTEMLNDYNKTKSLVNGYWLNIPQISKYPNAINIAIGFLNSINTHSNNSPQCINNNIYMTNMKNDYNSYISHLTLIKSGINSSITLSNQINITNYKLDIKTLKNNIQTINSYVNILQTDISNFYNNLRELEN